MSLLRDTDISSIFLFDVPYEFCQTKVISTEVYCKMKNILAYTSVEMKRTIDKE